MSPTRSVVDTCVWISAYIETEADHYKALGFIEESFRGRHRILIPHVQLTEIATTLAYKFRAKGRDPADALRLIELLKRTPTFKWLTVDDDYCEKAAKLGVKHALRAMDALIALAAMQSGYELITQDNDFHKSTLSTVIKMRRIQ